MTHQKTIRRLACIFVALLAVLATRTAQATTISTSTLQCGRWNVVHSPPILQGISQLNAVAAVSATDVWAVGEIIGGQGLTDHWNGSRWSIVPSPGSRGTNYLLGVAASGASNVWSEGWVEMRLGYQTITEHWNGKSWQLVASPNPGSDNLLFGVTMASTHQVWAVGSYEVQNEQGIYDPLIDYYC